VDSASAYLIFVSQNIAKARHDVQAFAKEVVRWINSIMEVYKDTKGGAFTAKVWNHLEEIRYGLISPWI